MKITVTRDTIGRFIGVNLLAGIVLFLSYLATAWVWWEANPGAWSPAARGTCLGVAFVLLAARWVAISVSIAQEVEA